MSTSIHDYITKSNQLEWQPLVENNFINKGIYVKSLRYDKATDRSKTLLIKFDPGASYPYHNHPAGEEIFVLCGEVIIENVTLFEGDYLYTPPNEKHSVKTETGCTLLFSVPEEVEIE